MRKVMKKLSFLSKKSVLIIISAFVLTAILLWLIDNKIGADVTTSTQSFLVNDGSVKLTIPSTVLNNTTRSVNSTNYKAINDYVLSVMRTAPKPATPSQKDQLIFLYDSQQNPLTGYISRTVQPTSPNFNFDSKITETQKPLFYNVWTGLSQFYGLPSDNRQLNIVVDDSISNPFYISTTHTIFLMSYLLNGDDIIAHEMAHSFHGEFSMLSQWEEGMAVAAETIYTKKPRRFNIQSLTFDLVNFPQRTYPGLTRTGNASYDFESPYAMGGTVVYKLYQANNNFLLNFNNALYSDLSNKLDRAGSLLAAAKIISQQTFNVEGEKAGEWLAHQYPFIKTQTDLSFIKSRTDSSAPLLAYNIIPNMSSPIYGKQLLSTYSGEQTPQVNFGVDTVESQIQDLSNIQINIRNYKGDPLAYGNNYLVRQPNNGPISGKLDFINPSASSYVGMAEIYIKMTNSSRGSRYYWPMFPESMNYLFQIISGQGLVRKYSVIGVLPDFMRKNHNTDKVNLTNIDTNEVTAGTITNGMFMIPNTPASDKEGRFKIDIISGVDNTIIATRYINKLPGNNSGTYYTVIRITQSSFCNLATAPTSETINNTSITVRWDFSGVCGVTDLLNGVPVGRSFGGTTTYMFANLLAGTTYNYKLMFADTSYLLQKESFSKSVKTTGGYYWPNPWTKRY